MKEILAAFLSDAVHTGSYTEIGSGVFRVIKRGRFYAFLIIELKVRGKRAVLGFKLIYNLNHCFEERKTSELGSSPKLAGDIRDATLSSWRATIYFGKKPPTPEAAHVIPPLLLNSRFPHLGLRFGSLFFQVLKMTETSSQ